MKFVVSPHLPLSDNGLKGICKQNKVSSSSHSVSLLQSSSNCQSATKPACHQHSIIAPAARTPFNLCNLPSPSQSSRGTAVVVIATFPPPLSRLLFPSLSAPPSVASRGICTSNLPDQSLRVSSSHRISLSQSSSNCQSATKPACHPHSIIAPACTPTLSSLTTIGYRRNYFYPPDSFGQ